eukprot:snap_masked-scaffold_2-processed-gene-5.34-mRNA-1 protein AED:1.00 eAED:1.00 QI:0/0/0/0/1/1/2/0/60
MNRHRLLLQVYEALHIKEYLRCEQKLLIVRYGGSDSVVSRIFSSNCSKLSPQAQGLYIKS